MKLFSRIVGIGKPLVVLHGVFGSSDNLFTVCKKIAEAGFEVHMLDARNHGQSPRSEEFNYDLSKKNLKLYSSFYYKDAKDKSLSFENNLGDRDLYAINLQTSFPQLFAGTNNL